MVAFTLRLSNNPDLDVVVFKSVVLGGRHAGRVSGEEERYAVSGRGLAVGLDHEGEACAEARQGGCAVVVVVERHRVVVRHPPRGTAEPVVDVEVDQIAVPRRVALEPQVPFYIIVTGGVGEVEAEGDLWRWW